MRKSANQVGSIVFVDRKKSPVIHHMADHLMHVIGLVRIFWHKSIERVSGATNRILAWARRGLFFAVLRNEREQITDALEACHVVGTGHMGYATL